jgi:hypothetical protein
MLPPYGSGQFGNQRIGLHFPGPDKSGHLRGLLESDENYKIYANSGRGAAIYVFSEGLLLKPYTSNL